MRFTITKQASLKSARLGVLETEHGAIQTPCFMPVGTRGAIKALTFEQAKSIGVELWLANSYHLMLRPGLKVIEEAGGLHHFTGWHGPIVTDSGGYQIFSQPKLCKVQDDGIVFQSYIDGTRHFLSPEESMHLQKGLGADIVMCLDDYGKSRHTISWARICRKCQLQSYQSLFAIVHGNNVKELVAMDFDGYAIGGRKKELASLLPEEKPRYLMGTGRPRDIVEAVLCGVDLFDCVLPTRNGRRGLAYTWAGTKKLTNAANAADYSPIDPALHTETFKHSKAYIRHLLNVGELSGMTLMTIQNLAFYVDFMKQLRENIQNDTLDEFYKMVCAL